MSKTISYPILICCSIVALALASTQTTSVAQRVCCEGEEWLKWTDSRRTAFVDGYLIGYQDGYHGGCKNGTADWPQEIKTGTEANMMTKCAEQIPNFSEGTNKLVKEVTSFYQRYPEDQDIYIREILEKIGMGLTSEQIHKYPFMRHRSSAKP